jgi:hypothetical protein
MPLTSSRAVLILFAATGLVPSAFALGCSSDAATDSPPGTGGMAASGGRAGTGGAAGGDGSGGNGGTSTGTGGEAGAMDVDASTGGNSPSGDAALPPPFDASGIGTKTLPAPPSTWQEHWFSDHRSLLKLIDYNDDVALYYDDAVNRGDATWLMGFMTTIWHYARQVYGEMKDSKYDGRLYSIFHESCCGGGHPSFYFDESHDYRNVSDCGMGPWKETDDYAHDEPSHELGHVVESTTFGKHGSPAFPIWGDSKWMEFFQYDAYIATGMTADAERVFQRFTDQSDDFPVAGTRWFRDWFYPLWRDHGHAQVMVKFFQLLSENFPTNSDNSYSRDMNWGEFVHFTSGAAHSNLLEQAHKAFGPDHPSAAEFAKAQSDFPKITY